MAPITLARKASPELSSRRVLPDLTETIPDAAQLLAMIQALQAENEKLKSTPSRSLSLKVSEKGCLSAYGAGLNFRGVHLYASQWLTLLDHAETIREFITSNRPALAWKDQ